jgi:hypothetical protein
MGGVMTGRRARIEGAAAPRTSAPKPDLAAIVAQAEQLAGDEWGFIRTWPLESGLAWLADRLKG